MVSKVVSLWSSHKPLIWVHCSVIYIPFVCNVLQIKRLKQNPKLSCEVHSSLSANSVPPQKKQTKAELLSAGEIFSRLSSSCPVLLFSFCCYLQHECVPIFFTSAETPGQLLQYLKRSQFGRPVCLCCHGSQQKQACIGYHQINNPRS